MTPAQLEQNFNNFFKGLEIDLRTEIVQACPVDTGALKGSVTVDHKGEGVYEISTLYYGEFVEFGTVRQRANPFIRNTIYNKLSTLMKNNFERHFK